MALSLQESPLAAIKREEEENSSEYASCWIFLPFFRTVTEQRLRFSGIVRERKKEEGYKG